MFGIDAAADHEGQAGRTRHGGKERSERLEPARRCSDADDVEIRRDRCSLVHGNPPRHDWHKAVGQLRE